MMGKLNCDCNAFIYNLFFIRIYLNADLQNESLNFVHRLIDWWNLHHRLCTILVILVDWFDILDS